jgi:transcriptional regulator with XRE-family HTH domain
VNSEKLPSARSTESGVVAGSREGAAIVRHRLGARLRSLREARSMRLEDVAVHVGVRPSTLSRIETGEAPVRASYLKVILDLYGVSDPDERAELAGLARGSIHQDWLARYHSILPSGAGTYLGLEEAASEVMAFSALTVPGLLQSPDYAAAAIRAARPGLDPGTVRRLVTVTLRRHELLHDSRRRFRLILDESVLHRQIAPPAVMAGQLDHLAVAVMMPAVTVQVAVLARPWPVLTSSFALLRFADPASSDIACQPGPAGRVTRTTRQADLADLRTTFDALTRSAQSPEESAALIAGLAGPAPAVPGGLPAAIASFSS